MFCSKCGNQIPDGSAFCASCGTPVGGTANNGAAKNSSSEMPPIISSLISKTVKFFTGNGQADVVARAAQDKTWSGAILAAIGVIVYALTQMLNMRAFFRSVFQTIFGYEYSSANKAAGNMPIGATFGFSLLFAVVYALVLAVMVFAFVKLCKKDIALVSAVNVAAYASLPVIAMSILNMLFGLMWGFLPAITLVLAMIASLILIYQALTKVYSLEGTSFLPFMLVATVVTVVAFVGAYFTFTGVMNA